MDDLGVAIGLVLVIEGLVWALAPRFGRRLLEAASETPEVVPAVGGDPCGYCRGDPCVVDTGLTLVWVRQNQPPNPGAASPRMPASAGPPIFAKVSAAPASSAR